MSKLHADISSAATEIFVASVACSETPNLGIVAMVHKGDAGSVKYALVHARHMHALRTHARTGEGYAPWDYLIAFTAM